MTLCDMPCFKQVFAVVFIAVCACVGEGSEGVGGPGGRNSSQRGSLFLEGSATCTAADTMPWPPPQAFIEHLQPRHVVPMLAKNGWVSGGAPPLGGAAGTG